MKNQTKDNTQNAIAANIAVLYDRLRLAAEKAKQANAAMADGEQNQAIGTILDLERLLPEATALYTAAIALHRNSK